MKITYLGHSSFLIETDAGTRIVSDPFDASAYAGTMKFAPLNQSADIVTVSHHHKDHGAVEMVSGNPAVFDSPGVHSAKDVRMVGVETFHDGSQGAQRGKNLVFVLEIDGLRCAHFGDIGHVPSDDQYVQIGPLDVALLPVGGFFTIYSRQADKIAQRTGARIVVPMHYSSDKCLFGIEGVESFTKGKANLIRADGHSYEVAADSLPERATVVVLRPAL